MYKYYKNIGRKGDTYGDVLSIIMDKLWNFFSNICNNDLVYNQNSYITPIDYNIDYDRIHDQHTTLNLFDPVLYGNQLFSNYFYMDNDVDANYDSLCFNFDWMKTPVIMYVPNSINTLKYNDYDLTTNEYLNSYSPAVICFTFNPSVFTTDIDEYYDDYTKHNIYTKISNGKFYPYEEGVVYDDHISYVYPIWIISPFNHSPSDFSISLCNKSNILNNDMSMFVSLEKHTLSIGFVDHDNIDRVNLSFISSMPYSRLLPGCDLSIDYLVRSNAMGYKKQLDNDFFIFCDSDNSPQIKIMGVNATVDANVHNDILFDSDYRFNFHSYKNFPMFDNHERRCWVNRFKKKDDDDYFYVKDGNILNTNNLVPTLSTNIRCTEFPYYLEKTVVMPNNNHYSLSPNPPSIYEGDPNREDDTYYYNMFPNAERNTLNSHIFMFSSFIYVCREPVSSLEEYSPFCKLDFIYLTDVMYHHNRDVFELNLDNNTYFVYEPDNGERQLALLVNCKLDVAV